MSTTKVNKPDIVQSFDFYKDREYYKITPGFLFSGEKLVRVDRLENEVHWKVTCIKMPDSIEINGKNYKLVQIKKS